MAKESNLLKDPIAAIRYALMIAQDENQDAIDFLQSWLDKDTDALSAWDFDGSCNCVPERS